MHTHVRNINNKLGLQDEDFSYNQVHQGLCAENK